MKYLCDAFCICLFEQTYIALFLSAFQMTPRNSEAFKTVFLIFFENMEYYLKCFYQVSTARYWFKRYEQDGNVNVRARPGRPKVLSAQDEADIIQRIQDNPFLTAISFAREYDVHKSVIRSLFLSHGIKCRTAATKLRLTEDHRTNRIAFCQTLLEEWDENRLASIIFSDEKTFSTDVLWRSKVYRPDKTRYFPEYTKVEDKSGHITNNYWGAIGLEGPVTPLVTITGRFNSQSYLRILCRHVTPMMQQFENNDDPRIFMQDNSPVHTAENVMRYFSNRNYELLDWPAKSPDLNPIENVWSWMTKNWPTLHPRNQQNLHDAVQERWLAVGRNQGIYFQEMCLSIRLVDNTNGTQQY